MDTLTQKLLADIKAAAPTAPALSPSQPSPAAPGSSHSQAWLDAYLASTHPPAAEEPALAPEGGLAGALLKGGSASLWNAVRQIPLAPASQVLGVLDIPVNFLARRLAPSSVLAQVEPQDVQQTISNFARLDLTGTLKEEAVQKSLAHAGEEVFGAPGRGWGDIADAAMPQSFTQANPELAGLVHNFAVAGGGGAALIATVGLGGKTAEAPSPAGDRISLIAEESPADRALMETLRRAGEDAPEAVKKLEQVESALRVETPPVDAPVRPEAALVESVRQAHAAERRTDTATRSQIEKLMVAGDRQGMEKLLADARQKGKQEADIDPLTGLAGSHAWNEYLDSRPAVPTDWIALVDADGLKWLNDHYGHAQAGDELLKSIGAVLKGTGFNAFRIHGDEFSLVHGSRAELEASLAQAEQVLEEHTVGETGLQPRMSWGIGRDAIEADKALKESKARRVAEGKRSERGGAPPDFKGTDFPIMMRAIPRIAETLRLEDLPNPGEAGAEKSAREVELSPEALDRLAKGEKGVGLLRVTAEKAGAVRRAFRHAVPAVKDFPTEAGRAVLAEIETQIELQTARFNYANTQFIKMFARLSHRENVDFIGRLQRGKKPLPVFKGAADFFQAQAQAMYRDEIAVGEHYTWRSDYFPQLFKDPVGVKQYFRRRDAKMGKPFFEKQRTFDDVIEAINAGFEPVSYNPAVLMAMRKAASLRIMRKGYAIQTLSNYHLIRPAEDSGSVRPGEILFEDHRGEPWIGPENLVSMLKNGIFKERLFDSKSVAGALLRGVRYAKNAFSVPILLPGSFHLANIELAVNPAQALRRAFSALTEGPMSKERVLYATKTFAKAIVHMGNTPEVWGKPISGWRIVRAFDGKVTAKELNTAESEGVRRSLAGGFNPRGSVEMTNMAKANMLGAIARRQWGRAGAWFLPAAARELVHPVMDIYVPLLKTRAYLAETDRFLIDHPDVSPGSLAESVAFRRMARAIDQRYGELSMKKEFWENHLTAVLQSVFLSYGWNFGFVAQFGGGAKDMLWAPLRLLGAKPAYRAAQSRAAYTALYILNASLVGGLYHWFHTGQKPNTVKDLLYPVQYVDANGNAHRVVMPFMSKEFGALYYHMDEAGMSGLGDMLLYKAAPLFSMVGEQLQNRNFYDQQISDPADPAIQRLEERFHALVDSEEPIPLQSYRYAAAGATPEQKNEILLSAWLGINPAPGYVSAGSLVNRIHSTYSLYHRDLVPYAKVQQALAARQLRGLFAAGRLDAYTQAFNNYVTTYHLTAQQLKGFEASLREPEGSYEFLKLPVTAQKALWETMTQDEKLIYWKYLAPSIRTTLSPYG